MLDQAATLRQLAHNTNKELESQVISFVSGKIGEGAVSITVKLGMALAIKGKKVLIILETMDKEALYMSQPFTDILSCHSSNLNLKDYIIDGPFGVKILQGYSDINKTNFMGEKEKKLILEKLSGIGDFNYIIIDAGACKNNAILSYISLSNMVYVLTNPQISSIMETYSLIKAINNFKLKDKVKLLVYKAKDLQEGNYTYNNIKNVGKRFLDITIEYSGVLVGNLSLEENVWDLEALLDEGSTTSVNEDIERIAGEILTSHMD